MDDNLHKQLVYNENRKSVGIAYLLWFFLGGFGAHRFYAGKTKSGVVRLLLLLIPFIGWTILALLWLIDLFLIPGMISEQNMKTINMINHGDPKGDRRAQFAGQLRAPDMPDPSIGEPSFSEPGFEPRYEPQPAPSKPMSEAERKRQAMLEDLRKTGYRKERRDRGLYG